jgi:hypothetical protein
MNELTINDVLSIRFDEIHDQTDKPMPYASRLITVETAKGTFEIRLYASDIENLGVTL